METQSEAIHLPDGDVCRTTLTLTLPLTRCALLPDGDVCRHPEGALLLVVHVCEEARSLGEVLDP